MPIGPRLGALPADTVVAFGVSGADRQVRKLYEQAEEAGLTDELESFEHETGLTLPDDLVALVGSSTVAAVGGTVDDVDYGIISRTDDVDRARAAADGLLTALGSESTITLRPTSGGTVIANSPEYADKLAGPGTLGSSELFRTALPT